MKTTAKRPDFLIPVHVYGQTHEYHAPERGDDLRLALKWMLSVYDNVHLDYGQFHGAPYCYLCGDVRRDDLI